jgi:hypothetical protein
MANGYSLNIMFSLIMISRGKILIFCTLLVGGVGLTGLAFWGLHQRYVPSEAVEISRRFISLIESGDLREAYALTTQDSLSGSTFESFETKTKNRISQTVFVSRPPIQWVGVRNGFQTYGNRLRRWLAGRKLDPDTLSLEFTVGAPFEVRLVSAGEGRWKISYFQTHAA